MNVDLWVLPGDVRTYANIDGTTARYSDANIGSNIRAAARFLQKVTGRQWQAETATKVFTTGGEAQLSIPDLRSVSSVSLQNVALIQDTSFWLIPSRQDQAVYTAVQIRPFNSRGRGYLANPQWFDRNLDRDWYRGGYDTGLPNDLSIVGNWGWAPITEDVQHAVKVLASFYLLRPDALLANARQGPDGSVFDLSALPQEVRDFIHEWRGGQMAAVL